MDSISQRNEAYVSDSVLTLSLIEDIETQGRTIESYVSQYNNGLITDNSIIFDAFDRICDEKMKLDDIVSSINMHGWKVVYEDIDLEKFSTSTRKHCFISRCTLGRSFSFGEFVPSFSFDITNLGLGPIDESDEITVRIYNDAINQSSTLQMPVQNNITNILDSRTFVVENLPCPQIPYEYNLEICIKNKDSGSTFGNLNIEGINILSLLNEEAI